MRKNKKFTEEEKDIYRLGFLNGEDHERRKKETKHGKGKDKN